MINESGITLSASEDEGIFRAVTSLKQLIENIGGQYARNTGAKQNTYLMKADFIKFGKEKTSPKEKKTL